MQMIRRAGRARLVEAIKQFGSVQAGNYAMAVALAGFLALFPLMLGILSITGLFLPEGGNQTAIYNSVSSIFPGPARPEILSALHGVKHNAGILGVVSIAGLFWAGSSFFATMEFAFARVYSYTQRGFVRQRLMGISMIVVFTVAIVMVIGINAGISALDNAGPSWIRLVVATIISVFLLTVLAVVIFKVVPNRDFRFRDVLPGAVVSGVAIEAISLLFPLYANVTHGFNTYGQQFALFFLLVTWMTLLSQVLMFGAIFNQVRLPVSLRSS